MFKNFIQKIFFQTIILNVFIVSVPVWGSWQQNLKELTEKDIQLINQNH